MANPANTSLASVVKNAYPDPGRVIALVAKEHYIRDIDRRFTFDNARLPHIANRLHVLLDHVHAFNKQLLSIGIRKSYFALFSAIFTGDNQHGIIFPNFHLKNLWSQRNNFRKFFVTQLTRDRTENAGPLGIIFVADNDSGILVKPDVRTIDPAVRVSAAHDHGTDNITFLYRSTRRGPFYRSDDDVADPGVFPAAAAEETDAHDLPCTRIVCHF
jgi:hypothetical protein